VKKKVLGPVFVVEVSPQRSRAGGSGELEIDVKNFRVQLGSLPNHAAFTRHLVKNLSPRGKVITYLQTLQMVWVPFFSSPRMKKYAISSAVFRLLFFSGGLKSSGEAALVGASEHTLGGGRVVEGGANEAEESLDDSSLSTLSKSNSSPE
jgi:hypothetical protein